MEIWKMSSIKQRPSCASATVCQTQHQWLRQWLKYGQQESGGKQHPKFPSYVPYHQPQKLFSSMWEELTSNKRALMQEPPNLDPTEYGWFKDEATKSLQPVMLPPTKLSAPDYILKLVCCSCSSAQPCHSSRCGCVATSPRLHTETCMLLVFICTTMSFK